MALEPQKNDGTVAALNDLGRITVTFLYPEQGAATTMIKKFIVLMGLMILVAAGSSSASAGELSGLLKRMVDDTLHEHTPKPGIHPHPENLPMVWPSPAIEPSIDKLNMPMLFGRPTRSTTKLYLVNDTFLENAFPNEKALFNKQGIKLRSISVTETEEEFPKLTQEERQKKEEEKSECSIDAEDNFIRHFLDEMHENSADIWKAIQKAALKTCANDIEAKCEYRGHELTFNFNIRDDSLSITPGFKYKFGPHFKFEGKGPTLELESSSNQLPHGDICQKMAFNLYE